jgi:uncharacterized membrane protein YbhN (UPF0104 family)
MSETMRLEGSFMKREGMILNIVCLIFALGFILLAVWTFISAGGISAFLSIDNLFLFVVSMFLAFVFFSLPATWMLSTLGFKSPFGSSETEPAAARSTATPAKSVSAAGGTRLVPAKGAAARLEMARDAKGRPIPPDVQRMLKAMGREQEQTS